MKDSLPQENETAAERNEKKNTTPLLTGISKLHLSPDTGRLSIPMDRIFSKQIEISATILEESIKEVFSLGLATLSIIADALPDPGQMPDLDLVQKIEGLKTIKKEELVISDGLPVDELRSPWVYRVMKLAEHQALSITFQKPHIKALKVLSIRIEMEAKQILELSALVVQSLIGTIDYMDMSQQQIFQAIAMQVGSVRDSFRGHACS